MIRIGLTGNIASGKSIVQKYLEQKNISVIDADAICHDLLMNDSKTIEEVKKAFANYDILDGEKLAKKKIAEIIYSDLKKKKSLEEIIHPKIKEKIEDFLESKKHEKIAVVAVPLLFEAGMQSMFDKIIFVSASLKTRVERLMKRNNINEEFAIKMIKAQQPESEKLSSCDYIVKNEATIDNNYHQVDKILCEIMR